MSSTGGGKSAHGLSRRAFLKAAVASGAAIPLLPLARDAAEHFGLASSTTAAGASPLPGGPFFLLRNYTSPSDGAVHDLWATAQAICARIIPTTKSPITGAVTSPGATEAGAVNYIDMFLASFQGVSTISSGPGQLALPAGLVSGPPIYLAGRYSGRYPSDDPTTGAPSATPTPDDFESAGGPIRFLTLTPAETMSWYLRLYGTLAGCPLPSWASSIWQQQVQGKVAGLAIPGPSALRGHVDPGSGAYVEGVYEQGLVAFDDWAAQNFQVPSFAAANRVEQDALLALASNPLLGAASSNGFPGLPAPLPNPVPPPAAANLYGVIALHTIQGTYGLPEYAGRSDVVVNGTGKEPAPGTLWSSIGWDGDTQPLGNSLYRFGAANTGYGSYTDPVSGTQQPQGGYVEYRAVSTPDAGDGLLATASEIVALIEGLVSAGVLVVTKGGGL